MCFLILFVNMFIRLNLQNANIFFNKIKVITVIICIISSENLIAYKEMKM